PVAVRRATAARPPCCQRRCRSATIAWRRRWRWDNTPPSPWQTAPIRNDESPLYVTLPPGTDLCPPIAHGMRAMSWMSWLWPWGKKAEQQARVEARTLTPERIDPFEEPVPPTPT